MSGNEKLYEEYLKKYDTAINNGFYIEAICIIYAILESELYKFLYLSGCINNKGDVTKKFKKEYKEIWHLKETYKFNIKNISSKRKYILAFLEFADNNIIINCDIKKHEDYFNDLKGKLCNNVNFSKVRSNFSKMEKWCDIRNKIIHRLLKVKSDKEYVNMEACAKDGLKLCNELRDIVNEYQNGVNLRIKYKIQDVKD